MSSVSLPIVINDNLQILPDSLKNLVDVENTVLSLNTKIDSLNSLQLPADSYRRKLDSAMLYVQKRLASKRSKHTDSVDTRKDALIKFYHVKITRYRHRLDTLSPQRSDDSNGESDVNSPVNQTFNPDEFKMPDLKSKEVQANVPAIRGIALPAMKDIRKPSITLDDARNLPGDVDAIEDVKDIANQADEVKQVTSGMKEKVSDVRDIDVKEDIKNSPQTLERQVEKTDQVQAVKKELTSSALPKSAIENPAGAIDASYVQDVAKARTQKIVGDHLAGKEQTLTSAMEKMGKLQRKFDRVNDIRKPPRKVENALKAKPFIERFVPGLQIQVSSLDSRWKNFDISPNVNFLFHQNFRAGISGTFRLGANPKGMQFKTGMQHYEWRLFGDFKVIKGFYAHAEAQTSTFRSIQSVTFDKVQREWKETVNVGIFKTYRVTKYLKGSTVVLYDLDQIDETFNFGRLAVRFGIEFTFKKKKNSKDNPTILPNMIVK